MMSEEEDEVTLDDDINLMNEIKTPEYSKKQLLAMEKEVTGMYITGHPMDEYQDYINNPSIVPTKDLTPDDEGNMAYKDGQYIYIAGVVQNVKKKVTKNNTMMAFVDIEDVYGALEVIVFPKTLENYSKMLVLDAPVIINGRLSTREDEPVKILADKILPIDHFKQAKN
jgi:DNA polymerase-3 subunit alpha